MLQRQQPATATAAAAAAAAATATAATATAGARPFGLCPTSLVRADPRWSGHLPRYFNTLSRCCLWPCGRLILASYHLASNAFLPRFRTQPDRASAGLSHLLNSLVMPACSRQAMGMSHGMPLSSPRTSQQSPQIPMAQQPGTVLISNSVRHCPSISNTGVLGKSCRHTATAQSCHVAPPPPCHSWNWHCRPALMQQACHQTQIMPSLLKTPLPSIITSPCLTMSPMHAQVVSLRQLQQQQQQQQLHGSSSAGHSLASQASRGSPVVPQGTPGPLGGSQGGASPALQSSQGQAGALMGGVRPQGELMAWMAPGQGLYTV